MTENSNIEIQNSKKSDFGFRISDFPKVYLLVSGGPDSVYLFYHFLKKGEHAGSPLQQKKPFTVIHFNHHLRGKESDAEQSFVEDLCRKHHVPCLVKYLKFSGKSGIQDLARQARQKFCFELAEARGPAFAQVSAGKQGLGGGCVFVTAHHADDVLETLVMRAGRGAGIKGLCGIRSSITLTHPDFEHPITFVRPLLHVSKKRILNWLTKNKIQYCTDSSNSHDTYFRNRVRHKLLQTKIPDALKKNILQLTGLVQAVDDHFSQRLDELANTYPQSVPLEAWDAWPSEIQFRFFARRMMQCGFKQQVEQRHFKLALEKNVLRLGPAHFIKKKKGCFFSKIDG